MFDSKSEITCQCEAFRELSCDDPIIAKIIMDWNSCIIPVLFRKIINDFESTFKRVPTKDELIWVASEHLEINIRILKELQNENKENWTC